MNLLRFYFAGVWVDARRGVPLLAAAVASGVSLGFPLLMGQPLFSAGLADPLNFVLTATGVVLAPLAAGLTTLHVHRITVTGLAEIAGSTRARPATVVAISASSILLWFSLGLALLTLLMLRGADLSGPATGPAWMLLLAAYAILMSAVGLGAFCGIPGRGQWVAPLVAVSVFLVLYGGSYLSSPLRALIPIYPEVFYRLWLEPNIQLLAAQCLGLCSITALLALRRARPMGVESAGLLLVLRGASVVLLLATGLVLFSAVQSPAGLQATRERDEPSRIPCYRGKAIEICTWPESPLSAQQAIAGIARTRRALEGSGIPLPSRFKEFGLPGPGATLLTSDIGGRVSIDPLRAFTDGYGDCGTQTSIDAGVTLNAYITAVVTRREAGTGIPAADRILRLPENQRASAVASLISDARCEP